MSETTRLRCPVCREPLRPFHFYGVVGHCVNEACERAAIRADELATTSTEGTSDE
jgi:hypothetical protein